jgi:hypothetical protein
VVESPGRAAPWVPVAAAAALFAAGAALTRHGAAVTPDSVQYLSAAVHAARGQGLASSITDLPVTPAQVPFAAWPPLYPLGLAALLRLGLPLFEAARWLGVVLTALAAFPLAAVARRTAGPRAVGPAVLAYALFFPPVMLAGFAWSEPAFILLSLSSLALLGRALSTEPRYPWPEAAAGLLAGAAMLTRYVGFTLIGASVVGLWLLTLERAPRRFWGGLLAYLLPAALPNALWLGRNRLVTGFWFGDARPEAWFPVNRILADLGRTLTLDWVAPSARLGGIAGLALGITGAAGALLLLGLLASRARALRYPEPRPGGGLGFVLWLYAATFLLAMIVLSRQVGFDPLNTRYLVPAYPALLVLAIGGIGWVLRSDRRRGLGPAARNLLATSALLLAVPQITATGTLIARAGTEDRALTRPYWTSTGWNDASWSRDPGLRRLSDLAGPDRLVISNVWELVGLRLGVPAKPLPEAASPDFPARLIDFPGAVIAVNRTMRTYRAGPADLRSAIRNGAPIEDLGRAGDWSFFRVLPEPETGR